MALTLLRRIGIIFSVLMFMLAVSLGGVPVSPLAIHVGDVVALTPRTQMCGINTGRIIASMQDLLAINECSMVQFEREPVREDLLPSDSEHRVSSPDRAGFTDPAFAGIADGDAGPESVNRSFHDFTIPQRAGGDAMSINFEQFFRAIADQESSNNYGAVGPSVNGDRAYGKYLSGDGLQHPILD